ncbi:unnamed protein product [Cuscuta epithymum]|uniref:X8 domain-containing protein n=1 Tax=Cuscuta epithymum TaxID=186058 RepID=A0AAV0GCN4_9ASTE|nr:unnamed protein product [Cuscuta epithymum]
MLSTDNTLSYKNRAYSENGSESEIYVKRHHVSNKHVVSCRAGVNEKPSCLNLFGPYANTVRSVIHVQSQFPSPYTMMRSHLFCSHFLRSVLLAVLLATPSYSEEVKKYCLAKPTAPPKALQEFIDTNCGDYGCSQIHPGGPCYQPNTLTQHASFVLDLIYALSHVCNTTIGHLTTDDPSTPDCCYPGYSVQLSSGGSRRINVMWDYIIFSILVAS